MSKLREETPSLVESLAAETREGADSSANLAKRLARFSGAKERALEMRDYIARSVEQTTRAQRVAAQMRECGSYLLFRHYTEVDRVRLAAMHSCKHHLLCPFCAIRRGAKMLARYVERFQIVQAEHPELLPYMVTLTVKNGPDLAERYSHLHRSVKHLGKSRHRYRGTAPEICKAAGAVWSYEFKRGAGSGLWHPHMHGVWLCTAPLDAQKLSSEWHSTTGDSFIVDAHAMYGEPVDAFAEVFKYAVKFADLPLADNWAAAQTLKAKRLIRSSGLLWGVAVPETLTDDELLEGSPYVELFYRFIRGMGYVNSDGEIHRAAYRASLERPYGHVAPGAIKLSGGMGAEAPHEGP